MATDSSSLAQWVHKTLGQEGVRLKIRLRGNNLQILCESDKSLEAKKIVSRLIEALKGQQGEAKLPIEPANPIHEITLYGRTLGKERLDWSKKIKLKSQENAQVSEPSAPEATDGSATNPDGGDEEASIPSPESPEMIASYLQEPLLTLGVSVKVIIQNLPEVSAEQAAEVTEKTKTEKSQASVNQRLWVICNSDYSPDSSLLTDLVIEQLRNLRLSGFRDAAICSQVSGEAAPEWMLRVDLTPPEVMLKDWAHWGDVQAIAWMLNQTLASQGMLVRAVQKESTLHLFCSVLVAQKKVTPKQGTAVKLIQPLLESLAPQGIQGATIYGVESDHNSLAPEQEKLAWIDWLNLPAAEKEFLANSAYDLAKQGNQDALTFLLERLLNPDLERRLATGGIQVKIRRKQNLLHVMSEAPVCPPQTQVGSPVARFIRELAISEIVGVRVYGRRAGATSPSWNYGVNFVHRSRQVPEATPEFAPSDAYLHELVAPTEAIRTNDLSTPVSVYTQVFEPIVQGTVESIKLGLCSSQLFVPLEENQELAQVNQNSRSRLGKFLSKSHQGQVNSAQSTSTDRFSSALGRKVALVWGTLGLLVTIQADWLIGQQLHSRIESLQKLEQPGTETTPVLLPQISLQKNSNLDTDEFNDYGFTTKGEKKVIVNYADAPNQEGDNSRTPEKSSAATAAMLATARSPNPSLNNPLLDQKLALYQQRLLKGSPPDILIVGSSRALRGVDPHALEAALVAQGYPKDIEVFNFGINGATAQVVDLMTRRLLTPEQLPKLIIWADGARAFNSGRVDKTYNAIATSVGYQHLADGTFPNLNHSTSQEQNQTAEIVAALSRTYQEIDNLLNQQGTAVSATYPQRDLLKSWVREQFVGFTSFLELDNPSPSDTFQDLEKVASAEEFIDLDGFLPLSVRFDPATYYQEHPKVIGAYDRDYESFQLSGKQDIALESLLQFTQENNVGIVFVNLPLTTEYLDPVRTKYEAEFQQYLRGLSVERELIFLDFTKLLLTQPENFSDPSHLNRYGAYKVSHQLVQETTIPWSLVLGRD
ncbi:MAG: DUF1574 domain-containing protein [Symploca sp. SIO1B1]|nr:DUF1574 domain-containing protein [Symploca sp. SIO1C2]NER96738.1 DUF1574 domain-containing protein [Symploca sp. SIO1B1]